MSGLRKTFWAGGEALFRGLGNLSNGAVKAFDRVADWCAERAR